MVSIRMNMRAIKGQFLDRQQILNAYDKAAIRGLNRFGATTRMIARRSMRVRKSKATFADFDKDLIALVGSERKRDASGKFLSNQAYNIAPWPMKPSPVGRPPFARSRKLKDKIFYIAERSSRSVIIGPQVWAKNGDDMGALETGGVTTTQANKWVAFYDGGVRKIRLVPKGGRRVRLKARPYMEPAYNKAVEKLIPGIWKNSL